MRVSLLLDMSPYIEHNPPDTERRVTESVGESGTHGFFFFRARILTVGWLT